MNAHAQLLALLSVLHLPIFTLIALTACHPYPTQPTCDVPPEHVDGPRRTARAIQVACEQFAEHGPTDLGGVSIHVSDDVVRSKAFLGREPAIFVDRLSATWERELYHEIWHVLLYRSDPLLSISVHHAEMYRRGLCIPTEICGR